MENNIQTVEDRLRQGNLSPEECATFRAKLSGEYSFWAGIQEDIVVRRAKTWATMRLNHKSDKATDREWEATEDGINEVGIEIKLKRIDKMMSGLSSLLRLAEGQARNQF